jgi:signal transduction histidine kinase
VLHNDQNNAVVILLKDNGHGISKAENPRNGHGMSTMRKRATELGGSLRVDSGADGTTVRLFLPEKME